jgi:mono/diheme cytochrome c family protein
VKKAFKAFWIFAAVLLGLLVIAALTLYALGRMRLNRRYEVPAGFLDLPSEPVSLDEGRRIFQYRGCEACHGEQLQGLVYLDNPAIGQVITPNLTTGEGGIASQRTDSGLVRAVKYGLRPEGTPLLFMPSTEFYYLGDTDLVNILAYIRSVPPVDNEMPPSELSITGFLVMNLTRDITFLPAEIIPHDSLPPPPPEPGITSEYGAYLSISCQVCHGLSYAGGPIPGLPPEWPAAPNLTSGPGSRLPAWGVDGFITILRSGGKHGRRINPAQMPWTSYRHMTDDELRAVYLFLMSLPPGEFGSR